MNLVNSAGQKRSLKVYQLILGHLVLLFDGNSESSGGYEIFDYALSCKMSRIYPCEKNWHVWVKNLGGPKISNICATSVLTQSTNEHGLIQGDPTRL